VAIESGRPQPPFSPLASFTRYHAGRPFSRSA
jgi:hypothetical protein